MTDQHDRFESHLSARLHAELDEAPVPPSLLMKPDRPGRAGAYRRPWLPALAAAAAIVILTTVTVTLARTPRAVNLAAPGSATSGAPQTMRPHSTASPTSVITAPDVVRSLCGRALSTYSPKGGLDITPTPSSSDGPKRLNIEIVTTSTSLTGVVINSSVVVTDDAGKVLGESSSTSPIGPASVDLSPENAVAIEPVLVDSFSKCKDDGLRTKTTQNNQLWVLVWVTPSDGSDRVLLDGLVRVRS